MSNVDHTLDECGCCVGVVRLTPASLENLPGLSALSYRVGTHGAFKSSMQSALSGQEPLRRLTTREDDDPAISILDGWAIVLDVLSFYQERIANEGYLRTATERRSILELARSIGYELRPGVAAGTFLAFTLQTAPGSPPSARVPIGTKGQSTPGQDESPQIFETTEEINAFGAWNDLRPRQTEFVAPKRGLKTIYLKGTSTNLKPGDALLVIGDERVNDPGNENWDFRRVVTATPVASTDPNASYTVVALNEELGSSVPRIETAKKNPRIYALRQRASIFGYNAAEWKALSDVIKAAYLGISDPSTLTPEQKSEWPNYTIYVSAMAMSAAPPQFIEEEVEPEAEAVFEAAKAAAEQTAQKLADDVLPGVWTAGQSTITAINSVLNSVSTVLSNFRSTGALTESATRSLADALKSLVVMPGDPNLGDLSNRCQEIIDAVREANPDRVADAMANLAGSLASALANIAAFLKKPPLDLSSDNVKKVIVNLNTVLNYVDPLRRSLEAVAASDLSGTRADTQSAIDAAKFAAGKLAGATIAREAAAFITFAMNAALTGPLLSDQTRLGQVVRVGYDATDLAVSVVQAENEIGLGVIVAAYPELLPLALALYAAAKLTQGDQTLAATRVRSAVIHAIDAAKAPLRRQKIKPPPPALQSQKIRTIDLDTLYPKIVSGRGWLVVSSPDYQEVYEIKSAVESARAEYGISGKTTRIKISGENYDKFTSGVRTVNVYAESEQLEFAEQPLTTSVSGSEIPLELEVDGLSPDQLVAVSGADNNTGEPIAEIATIGKVERAEGRTKLVLTANLAHSFRRDSVRINANVARATHGETKQEVLGSGNASAEFQKFKLKQKPLTFISAPTSSGTETTLEVRVNEIRWDEARDFYQLGPKDRSYTTRIADDGTVTVQFGDGVTGARVPTGAENISAKYRIGIGLGGLVKAGQINLLMSPILGVTGVANPLAPTGAEDPERLEQARQNAPLTVLTLDRIVSIRDFEDFTRAFAGIGKAQATWLWDGEKRLIHLTVAAADGGEVSQTSLLYRNLVTAIDSSRHVDQRVLTNSYKPLLFDLAAKILVDPAYLFKDVKAAVEAALRDSFSFASRSFGQAVTASEVIAVMQKADGVVAIDLDKLYFDGTAATLKQRLPANIAHWEVSAIVPAELLTINTGGITLTEIPG